MVVVADAGGVGSVPVEEQVGNVAEGSLERNQSLSWVPNGDLAGNRTWEQGEEVEEIDLRRREEKRTGGRGAAALTEISFAPCSFPWIGKLGSYPRTESRAPGILQLRRRARVRMRAQSVCLRFCLCERKRAKCTLPTQMVVATTTWLLLLGPSCPWSISSPSVPMDHLSLSSLSLSVVSGRRIEQ